MTGKRMAAKYAGTCTECGGVVNPGDAIVWHGTSVVEHVDCPKPKEPPAPEHAPTESSSLTEQDKQKLHDVVRESIERMRRTPEPSEHPGLDTVSSLNGMLAEYWKRNAVRLGVTKAHWDAAQQRKEHGDGC